MHRENDLESEMYSRDRSRVMKSKGFEIAREINKGGTNMLSWGVATEGVCARGGPRDAKADNEFE